jgi:hypothetical protein
MIPRGLGLGYDEIIISFHQTYSSYDKFRNYIKHDMAATIIEMNMFLINLDEEKNTLAPTFAFLAREIMNSRDKTT